VNEEWDVIQRPDSSKRNDLLVAEVYRFIWVVVVDVRLYARVESRAVDLGCACEADAMLHNRHYTGTLTRIWNE